MHNTPNVRSTLEKFFICFALLLKLKILFKNKKLIKASVGDVTKPNL